MISNIETLLPQSIYKGMCSEYEQFMAQCRKAIETAEPTSITRFMDRPMLPMLADTAGVQKHQQECAPNGSRWKSSHQLLKSQAYNLYGDEGLRGAAMFGQPKTYREGFSKATAVYTSLGYNFYDLRAPVFLLYPVNVPFRNAIPRTGRVNDGYGTAAHWKATRNVGSPYAGAAEGKRVAAGVPDEVDYAATYKEIGNERGVTFTAQYAGEGFADNLADEHLRGLHALFLQEEAMDIGGNGGVSSVSNGYQLGTAPTPTATATLSTSPITTPDGVSRSYTSTFAPTTTVSVAVVALTYMGAPTNGQYGYAAAPSVANGVAPTYTRTNADGSTDTINGGCSAISALSATATGDATHVIVAQIPAGSLPIKGAFQYAWYVSVNAAPTTANTFLWGITSTPWAVITGPPAGTQAASAAGLATDHSANALDYDGLLTYVVSTPGAYYRDLQGGTLTAGKDGTVVEVETILQYIFDNFQAGVDNIWGDSTAIITLDRAIRWTGTGNSGYQFYYTRDNQNNLLGGYVVSAYQSRFVTNNPTGANAIPIRMHPMFPRGTLYFEISTNPYPHSRVGNVYEMLVQRDYYSIEWPVTTRIWTFGTYCHQVLRHNMPWMSGMITGIGAFVGN
jgi:hypothetical protein